jgi:hypothetical protein
VDLLKGRFTGKLLQRVALQDDRFADQTADCSHYLTGGPDRYTSSCFLERKGRYTPPETIKPHFITVTIEYYPQLSTQ